MWLYPLLLGCALVQDSPAPASPAARALEAQLQAGEQTVRARAELEALEEVLTQPGLSEADLVALRSHLEAAKVAVAEAEARLDAAEQALAPPPD